MDVGYVYHRDKLSRAERDALLAGLAGLQVVIHHSAGRIACEAWPPPAGALPTGRAFGPALEARWSPAGADWDVQVLSETPQALGPGWAETPLNADAPHTVTLWGRHWQAQSGAAAEGAALPEGWVQAEIPADLRYPVAGSAARPLVVARAITYRRDGLPQLTRFLSLEPAADTARQGENSR
jgi:hypothetical protein